METFWQSEEGKLFGYGIHEHNAGIGHAKIYLQKLKKEHPEYDDNIRGIETALKKCQDSMDYLYTKFKERFELK